MWRVADTPGAAAVAAGAVVVLPDRDVTSLAVAPAPFKAGEQATTNSQTTEAATQQQQESTPPKLTRHSPLSVPTTPPPK